MPTVAELAALDLQHVAWFLVIEGIPDCFVSRSDLAGSGASSWIGTSEGARVVHAGLEMSGNLSTAVKIGAGEDAGMLNDDGYTFKVRDIDDVLLALFAVPSSVEVLAGRLSPRDDPAPTDGVGLIDAVPLWGRYVGAEAIGPAGERRYYACLPGSTLPGMDHAASDAFGNLAPVEVTDAPQFREGRRVALYLLRRDPWGTAGDEYANWPNWVDQYEGGALVWWGQLRRGTVTGKDWTLACSGRSSWLAKMLNVNAPSQWRLARPRLELSTAIGEREDLIAVSLEQYDPATSTISYFGQSIFDPLQNFAALPVKTTVSTDVSGLVLGLLSDAGTDGVFEDTFNANAAFNDVDVSIRIDDQGGVLPSGAALKVTMHEKVWRLLGWEPQQQAARLQIDPTDPQAVDFQQVTDIYVPGAVACPGPGYWQANFTTWRYHLGVGVDILWDNDGATRTYQPMSSEGAYVLQAGAGQDIADGFDPVFFESQLARPPTAGITTDGADTISMAWVLFGAHIRRPGQEDPTEIRMVARVEWATADTLTESDGEYIFTVVEWYDPKWFGYAGRRLTTAISVPATADDDVSLRWVPLRVLGFNPNVTGGDNIARVLGRVLLSTGTASWSGTSLTPGDNAHPDAGPVNDDCEIADLGLAIPADLVDLVSINVAANANPGGFNSPLNIVRLAYVGAVSSEDVLKAILAPRHWAMSLRRNKFGIFSWTAPLSFEDVDVTIGNSDVADDGPPQVDLRPIAPVDKAAMTYGAAEEQVDPQTYEAQVASYDPGRAARNGRHVVELQGRGLPAPQRWVDVEQAVPAPWSAPFYELWGGRVGPWAASPMLSIRTRVRPPKSLSCQVGSIVRITNPWPATTLGAYGLTNAIGRVTAVELEPDTLCSTVEILVHPRDLAVSRRFGPIARVLDTVSALEERYDAGVLKCHGDAFARDDGTSDVEYFREPAWLNIGGDAIAQVWQWDGNTWALTMAGRVSAVDTTAHTITLTDIDGQFWERRYAMVILAPYADQPSDSWVREFFLFTTGQDGVFGATPGWKFYK